MNSLINSEHHILGENWDSWLAHLFLMPFSKITDTDKEFMVEVDMPGFTKDQVKIDYSDGFLTVMAEQKEEKKGCLKRQTFSRKFSLSESHYDLNKIDAKLENGVLKVSVPKLETKVRKFEVK